MEKYRQVSERLSKVFEKEIVFIVGATRWGTSWMQQCLDAHPDICCKGEGHFTDILFPLLARGFDDYNARAEAIGNRMRMGGLTGNAAGLTFDDVHHLMATAIGLMFERWSAGTEVRVIAEKTPEHIVALDVLAKAVPSLKVINVFRDGRDEAVSVWNFNNGLSRGEFRKKYPNFSDYAVAFASNWRQSASAIRGFERTHPGRCFNLRAEDLQGDSVAALAPLMAFLGVDGTEPVIKAAADTAWEAVPLDVDSGAWKKKFDDKSKRFFNRECGELMKLLGYELGT